MKLNPDCIRDILVTVESTEYNSAYTIDKLHEKLPAYTVEELNYHCLQMIDADLLLSLIHISAAAIRSIMFFPASKVQVPTC